MSHPASLLYTDGRINRILNSCPRSAILNWRESDVLDRGAASSRAAPPWFPEPSVPGGPFPRSSEHEVFDVGWRFWTWVSHIMNLLVSVQNHPILFVLFPHFPPNKFILICCMIRDAVAWYLAIFLSTFYQKALSEVLDDMATKWQTRTFLWNKIS